MSTTGDSNSRLGVICALTKWLVDQMIVGVSAAGGHKEMSSVLADQWRLVFEPKGVAGSHPMSPGVHMEPK